VTGTPIWRSIGELQAAYTAFQQDWWQDDDAVREECSQRPGLYEHLRAGATNSTIVSTVDVFKLDDGQWSPNRSSLHDRLVAGQIGRGHQPSSPAAYFTIGGMASGKTSRLRRIVHEHRAIRIGADPSSLSRIDADEIRQALPEYRDGRGSAVVNTECFDITYEMVYPAVRDAGMDLVYDTIGRIIPPNDISFGPNLVELKSCGYLIYLLLAEAPLEVCVQRAKRRALEENGRLIDIHDQQLSHGDAPKCLERLLAEPGLLDGWAVFDTYSKEGTVPILDGSEDWLKWYQHDRS
jgi:hypothetical protein